MPEEATRARPPDPERREVLSAGAVTIVSLVLPSATAAASGEAVAPTSVGALTFSAVTEDGFTVSWGA